MTPEDTKRVAALRAEERALKDGVIAHASAVRGANIALDSALSTGQPSERVNALTDAYVTAKNDWRDFLLGQESNAVESARKDVGRAWLSDVRREWHRATLRVVDRILGS